MSSMNKKGISEVIGVSIFILLSIISIYLVYSSINILISQTTGQLSPFVSCLNLIPSKIELVNYNEQTKDLEITVERSLSGEVSSFIFVLEKDGQTTKYECGIICGEKCLIPDLGQTKEIYLYTETKPEKVTLYVNGNCLQDSKLIQ